MVCLKAQDNTLGTMAQSFKETSNKAIATATEYGKMQFASNRPIRKPYPSNRHTIWHLLINILKRLDFLMSRHKR